MKAIRGNIMDPVTSFYVVLIVLTFVIWLIFTSWK